MSDLRSKLQKVLQFAELPEVYKLLLDQEGDLDALAEHIEDLCRSFRSKVENLEEYLEDRYNQEEMKEFYRFKRCLNAVADDLWELAGKVRPNN